MGNSSPYTTLILIALMVVAFYFLIIRPNKKRQQAQQQTMNSLTPGTRVLLTSGVFGTIEEIGDKQAVLELSPGVRLTVLKQAIARAVRPGDEDTDVESDHEVDVDDLAVEEPYPTDAGTSSLSTGTGTGTDGSSPWSPEAGGSSTLDYPATPGRSGTDQDPRPGTSTTPIKD